MTTHDVHELLRRYRAAAIEAGEIGSKRQNASADAVHACYKLLRQSSEGRQAIMELLNDSNTDVRLWAASHALEWSPEIARPVLESLRDNAEFPVNFTADVTLSEYDKGTLSFDD
jgi:HEAT repeat protein